MLYKSDMAYFYDEAASSSPLGINPAFDNSNQSQEFYDTHSA